MAGAGYKLFQTGDVLTAAQVNTYLNEQTVMVFANAAARTSALTSVLAEGMVSYLQDTNAVEVYNGSAWVGVSGAGDVTEVQAGTGISVASGTGPIPVVTNTMATAIDAEGDLIIGDAADAFQRLAIGSNTHVLTVDTSVDGKIKWAAPAGGGNFVKAAYGQTSSQVATTSTTYADTGVTATITPSSASNDIYVICRLVGYYQPGTASSSAGVRLMRGATQIAEDSNVFITATGYGGSMEMTMIYKDSPNTTSATTYKTQQKVMGTTATITTQPNSMLSTIMLLEVTP